MEKKTIMQTLVEAREKQKKSVAHMARIVEVSRTTYERFEKGDTMKLSFLNAVAKELGYSLENKLVKIK